MKKATIGIIAVIALLGSLSASAQIIFQDTFDGGGAAWGDLDFNLAARQAGGTTSSTYTLTGGGTVPGDSVVFNDAVLMRIHNASGTAAGGFCLVDLDTDFGPTLTGQEWALRFSSVRTGTGIGAGWSGFSVGINNPPGTPFANGFGFILRGTGEWVAFNGSTDVGSGTIAYGAAHHWYDIIATFDEVTDTVSLDFTDDLGTSTNLGTFPTSFGVGSTRFVGFRNHADAVSRSSFIHSSSGNRGYHGGTASWYRWACRHMAHRGRVGLCSTKQNQPAGWKLDERYNGNCRNRRGYHGDGVGRSGRILLPRCHG